MRHFIPSLTAIALFALIPGCGGAVDDEPVAKPLGTAQQAQRTCVTLARGATDDAVVFDAQVSEQSQAQTFGDSAVMNAGLYQGAGSERDTFVSFALPAWSCVSSATLTLRRGPVSPTNPGTLRLRTLAGPWTEDTLTWNNQPSDTGTVISTLLITGAEKAWSFDVKSYVSGALANPSSDFGLMLDKTDGGTGYGATTQFWSSEATTAASRPSLTLCDCGI